MRFLDLLCAGSLFLLSLGTSFLIPRTYTGRIWIYGTDLAVIFAAMLNLLRIQNGAAMRGIRAFCIVGNIAMLAFFLSLMIDIGMSTSLANAYIPLAAGLFLLETGFSFKERPVIALRESAEGVTFAVKIHPRAKKNAITGALGDALKVALTAPAVEGRANEACIELLAKLLKVPRSSITIASGPSSRNKVIRVTGVTAAQVRERLG